MVERGQGTGSAFGGLLVLLLTAPVALVADAISFLMSAVYKMRIRSSGSSVAPAAGERLGGQILEGLRRYSPIASSAR
jgi:hypothetical protein